MRHRPRVPCHILLKAYPSVATQLPQIVTIVKTFWSFLATTEEKHAATSEGQLPSAARWRPLSVNLLPALPVPHPRVTEVTCGVAAPHRSGWAPAAEDHDPSALEVGSGPEEPPW